MFLKDYISEFLRYNEVEKGLSETTVGGYGYELARLLHYFAENGLPLVPHQILTPHISQYLDHLQKERGYKPVSLKRVISIIKSFFNYLLRQEQGSIADNPARALPSIKVTKNLPQVLSWAETRQFLSGIRKVSSYPARDYAIFLLLLKACCRLQELEKLTVHCLDTRKRQVSFCGPGGKRRQVLLPPEVCRAVEDYLEIRRHVAVSEALFLSPTGKPLSKSAFGCLFKSLAKKTGIYRRGLSIHKLRHTCLAWQLQEGLDMGALQEMAGHASMSTTVIYHQVAQRERVREEEGLVLGQERLDRGFEF